MIDKKANNNLKIQECYIAKTKPVPFVPQILPITLDYVNSSVPQFLQLYNGNNKEVFGRWDNFKSGEYLAQCLAHSKYKINLISYYFIHNPSALISLTLFKMDILSCEHYNISFFHKGKLFTEDISDSWV